jgi:ribosomal protein L11 methyltransferase
MAFGTGHHQTTHQMMSQMQNMLFTNKEVLDFGCGTGILAILAEKLGAIHIDAIDIELASYENTIENSKINGCGSIHTFLGDHKMIPTEQSYDIILANITRNVLIQVCENLFKSLKPKGQILLSGILEEDLDIIREHYEGKLGMKVVSIMKRDKWMCLLFDKN